MTREEDLLTLLSRDFFDDVDAKRLLFKDDADTFLLVDLPPNDALRFLEERCL